MKKILYKVVDLSKWNGKVNFDKLQKDGFDGIIQRMGYGSDTPDITAYRNIDEALKRNMLVGAYWFMYSTSVSEAIQEAKNFNKYLEKYRGKLTLPVFADYEYDSERYAKKVGIEITKRLRTDMVKAFCETLEGFGWYVSNYANVDYVKNKWYQNELDQFDLWIAHWDTDKPSIDAPIWQYTEKGKSYGENQYTDLNNIYIDYPKIIKENGLNGFVKSGIKSDTQKVEAPVKKVSVFTKIGDWTYYIVDKVKQTGFQNIGDYWYYFRKVSGTQAFGWQFIDGKWYYFRNNTGTMTTGWQYIDGNWYYLNDKGQREDGAVLINNKLHYFEKSGKFIGEISLEIKKNPNLT